jgi:ATP-binding cassette subfamily B protein
MALASGGVSVLSGVITLGTLIAVMNYARQFFEPVEELANWFAQMQMAQASAERILGLITAAPEIQDSAEVRLRLQQQYADPALAADGYPARIQEIELRNVDFAYNGATGSNAKILSGINLKVRAGETIALVGPTGGGKSTLVNLICRFYEPGAGDVLIDGIDYRRRSLHWLQSNLGIVLQSAHIFSGTIADNIRYGDLAADAAQIETAAKLAGAHEFIMAMPHGYASEVGESGIRLSSGQKQLLSFARAILAKAQIMVLDEATSSVDTETEQRIQQGLTQVLAGRISFVIAHRLSTIRAADRILVIEHGRIREQGSHRELMALRGHYYEFYTRQSLREVAQNHAGWAARVA